MGWRARRASGRLDAESEPQEPRSLALTPTGPRRPGRRVTLPGVDSLLPPSAQLTPRAVFKWTGKGTGVPKGHLSPGFQHERFLMYTQAKYKFPRYLVLFDLLD